MGGNIMGDTGGRTGVGLTAVLGVSATLSVFFRRPGLLAAAAAGGVGGFSSVFFTPAGRPRPRLTIGVAVFAAGLDLAGGDLAAAFFRPAIVLLWKGSCKLDLYCEETLGTVCSIEKKVVR